MCFSPEYDIPEGAKIWIDKPHVDYDSFKN